MAQWKNNSNAFIEVEWWGAWNEPRIELPEGPFVHGCQASKKALGYVLHWILYWRDCPVNDMGNSPHHLTDIHYDMFSVTVLQHQYGTYCLRGMDGNCVKGETIAAA